MSVRLETLAARVETRMAHVESEILSKEEDMLRREGLIVDKLEHAIRVSVEAKKSEAAQGHEETK